MMMMMMKRDVRKEDLCETGVVLVDAVCEWPIKWQAEEISLKLQFNLLVIHEIKPNISLFYSQIIKVIYFYII